VIDPDYGTKKRLVRDLQAKVAKLREALERMERTGKRYYGPDIVAAVRHARAVLEETKWPG